MWNQNGLAYMAQTIHPIYQFIPLTFYVTADFFFGHSNTIETFSFD